MPHGISEVWGELWRKEIFNTYRQHSKCAESRYFLIDIIITLVSIIGLILTFKEVVSLVFIVSLLGSIIAAHLAASARTYASMAYWNAGFELDYNSKSKEAKRVSRAGNIVSWTTLTIVLFGFCLIIFI